MTIPIESSVNGLPGVTAIRSSSGGGLSFVWIDFEVGTGISRARFALFSHYLLFTLNPSFHIERFILSIIYAFECSFGVTSECSGLAL